jgi:hypothetical protein
LGCCWLSAKACGQGRIFGFVEACRDVLKPVISGSKG